MPSVRGEISKEIWLAQESWKEKCAYSAVVPGSGTAVPPKKSALPSAKVIVRPTASAF